MLKRKAGCAFWIVAVVLYEFNPMSAAISVLKIVIEQRGGVLDLQYMVLG